MVVSRHVQIGNPPLPAVGNSFFDFFTGKAGCKVTYTGPSSFAFAPDPELRRGRLFRGTTVSPGGPLASCSGVDPRGRTRDNPPDYRASHYSYRRFTGHRPTPTSDEEFPHLLRTLISSPCAGSPSREPEFENGLPWIRGKLGAIWQTFLDTDQAIAEAAGQPWSAHTTSAHPGAVMTSTRPC
jgi:hypothetical protein